MEKSAQLILGWILLSTSAPVWGNGDIGGMVSIPSGNFMAGKPDSLKKVFVEAFHIDRHEVTQEAFERRMGGNPAFFKGANRPVEDVNWFDANAYCRKAGKRLPTEWEWEKAAKAGSATPYYWGADMDGRYAWYKGNSEKQTHPVREKKPNRYGLYDMAGNVWEWTSSNFGAMGKVVRGGSWRNSPISLRSAHRIPSLPIHKFHYVGFRCAR